MLHDGEHWVNVNPDALSHAYHPEHEVSVCEDGRKRYVLEDTSPRTRAEVATLYAAKYGPDQGAVLLRLISP